MHYDSTLGAYLVAGGITAMYILSSPSSIPILKRACSLYGTACIQAYAFFHQLGSKPWPLSCSVCPSAVGLRGTPDCSSKVCILWYAISDLYRSPPLTIFLWQGAVHVAPSLHWYRALPVRLCQLSAWLSPYLAVSSHLVTNFGDVEKVLTHVFW